MTLAEGKQSDQEGQDQQPLTSLPISVSAMNFLHIKLIHILFRQVSQC